MKRLREAPIMIGRPDVIAQRIARYGLRMKLGIDVSVVNTEQDDRYRDYWQTYHALMMRKGVDQQMARLEMRRRSTLIGAMMIHKGEADGMVCGTVSTVHRHLAYIDEVIGHSPGAKVYAAMNGLILPGRQVFLVDTHINADPTADQLCEITMMAADVMRGQVLQILRVHLGEVHADARAGAAGINQLSFRRVVGQEQRAEMRARAFRIGPIDVAASVEREIVVDAV